MNNIDKRALREAADSVIQKYGSEWFETGRQLCTVHKSKIELIAAANPAVILVLLDELEAKDKSIGFLKDQLAQLANFNPDWDRLEAATDSLREHMAKLSAAEKRIAELEERTVTLPPKEHDNGTDSQIDINAGFANRMWQKCYDAIRAAGIGVKGE